MRISWLLVLLVACGSSDKDKYKDKDSPLPTPSQPTAPSAAAAEPVAAPPTPFMTAKVPPKELRGTLVRGGKLIDVATLSATAVLTGCKDPDAHGGSIIVGVGQGKGSMLLHIQLNRALEVAKPADLALESKKDGNGAARVWAYTTDVAGEGTEVHPIAGTLVAHKLAGELDVELDMDFGASGKLHTRIVTPLTTGECPTN